MESSGHAEEDIKEECVEIISSSDAESAVTAAAAMFMSAENEAGSESNNVFMTDDQETVSGASSGLMILRDREGIPSKPEKETVVTLIEMVRSQPQIWDITNAAYREKLLRKRSFRRIGEELGWSSKFPFYKSLKDFFFTSRRSRLGFQNRGSPSGGGGIIIIVFFLKLSVLGVFSVQP